MEDFQKKLENEDLVTKEETPEVASAIRDSGILKPESAEPNIDHWEIVKVMHKFGFTDINEDPDITKEMRDQNLMYGTDVNDKGERITTIWKDGYCWARKGSSPQLQEIEEEIGHTLRRGAVQPRNLVFEHTNIE